MDLVAQRVAHAQACEVPAAEMLRHRALNAIELLQRAAEVRKDAALMAAVRDLIRERRDDLATLLDDMGA